MVVLKIYNPIVLNRYHYFAHLHSYLILFWNEKNFKKLLLIKTTKGVQPKFNPIQKRIKNIQVIWNNDHQEDNGIEKIIRFILASSQLFFPGIYIKYWASKKGVEYQDLAFNFYVVLKVVFQIVILVNHWQSH